jgi:hypothetical protein
MTRMEQKKYIQVTATWRWCCLALVLLAGFVYSLIGRCRWQGFRLRGQNVTRTVRIQLFCFTLQKMRSAANNFFVSWSNSRLIWKFVLISFFFIVCFGLLHSLCFLNDRLGNFHVWKVLSLGVMIIDQRRNCKHLSR